MADLNGFQIKSIIYNAVGRASETATVPFTMLVVSTGNSGYSVGALQTDFGQNKAVGWDLVDHYQKWLLDNNKLSENDISKLKFSITQTGVGNNAELRLRPQLAEGLNNFLSSPDGVKWIAAQDEMIYQKKLENIIRPIQGSQAYSSLSESEGAEMIGRIAKAYNQNNKLGIFLKDELVVGRLTSKNFDEVFEKQMANPNAGIGEVARGALRSGQTNMLYGVRLFNALSTSKGDIGDRWSQLVASDPANLKGLASDPNSIFFDVLFRNPLQGLNLVNRLQDGQTSKGTLVYAPKGTSSASVVGFDKNGDLFVVGKDGSVERNFDKGWVPVVNGDEKGMGFFIRHSKDGKQWVLASASDANAEIPLADINEPIQIGAQSIQLGRNEVVVGAQDGSLVRVTHESNSSFTLHALTDGNDGAAKSASVVISGDQVGDAALVQAAYGLDLKSVQGLSKNTSISMTFDDGHGSKTVRNVSAVVSGDDGSLQGHSIVETQYRSGSITSTVSTLIDNAGDRTAVYDGLLDGRHIRISFDYEDNATARVIDALYVGADGQSLAPTDKASLMASLNEAYVTPDTLRYADATLGQLRAGDANAGVDGASGTSGGYGAIDPQTGRPYGVEVAKKIGAAFDNTDPTGFQTGFNNLANAIGATASFLSLVKAVQFGKPLPIITSRRVRPECPRCRRQPQRGGFQSRGESEHGNGITGAQSIWISQRRTVDKPLLHLVVHIERITHLSQSISF